MSKLDPKLMHHALSVARQHGFAEVDLVVGGESFTAKLDPLPKKRREGGASVEALSMEPQLETITATLVGYYRESKHPLKVGTQVKKGDIIAIVSALGIANDVESKVTGEIVEVLVEPNQPVEYGQALAKVKP